MGPLKMLCLYLLTRSVYILQMYFITTLSLVLFVYVLMHNVETVKKIACQQYMRSDVTVVER